MSSRERIVKLPQDYSASTGSSPSRRIHSPMQAENVNQSTALSSDKPTTPTSPFFSSSFAVRSRSPDQTAAEATPANGIPLGGYLTYDTLAECSREDLIQRVLQLQATIRQLHAAGKQQDEAHRSSTLPSAGLPASTAITAQQHSRCSSNVSSSSSPALAATAVGKPRASTTRRGGADASAGYNNRTTTPMSTSTVVTNLFPPTLPGSIFPSPSPRPRPALYDISMSVLVIDNGSVVVRSLPSILDKKSNMDADALEALMLRQPREADTPVVASRFLRSSPSMEGSMQRFSVGSCDNHHLQSFHARVNSLHEATAGTTNPCSSSGNFSVGSVRHRHGPENNSSLEHPLSVGIEACPSGSDPVTAVTSTTSSSGGGSGLHARLSVPVLPLHPLKDENGNSFSEEDLALLQHHSSKHNKSIQQLLQQLAGQKARLSAGESTATATTNSSSGGGSRRRQSLNITEADDTPATAAHRHPHDRDEDDEPSPKRPAHYHDPCSNEDHALALGRSAGLPPQVLYEGIHRRTRRASASPDILRDISLDSDAMVSGNTLRTFFHRFHSGRDGGPVLSPVSNFATAIYHYIVKTFSVQNGCQHLPDDVEGFGRTLLTLCGDVTRILKSEPRHGHMTSPCYVFGDLHGNFRDLFYFMDNLISFQDLRYTPHKFMFLGDYVDRGEFSVEVVAYLFSMKVLAPEKVILLRGNHEDTLVSGDISGYGNTSFRAQCHALFGMTLGEEVWGRVSQVFTYLPLTANIDKVIFCTHGGIPRYNPNETEDGVDDRLEQLMRDDYPRFASFFEVPEREPPEHARLRRIGMDTCWADPADDEEVLDEYGFGDNPRGTGVILFGNRAVDTFLDHYGFQYIFRAHQEKAEGLKLSKNARVFTIFSTSSYVGHQNGAGVVLVADGMIRLMIKSADVDEDEDEEEEDVEEELMEDVVVERRGGQEDSAAGGQHEYRSKAITQPFLYNVSPQRRR